MDRAHSAELRLYLLLSLYLFESLTERCFVRGVSKSFLIIFTVEHEQEKLNRHQVSVEDILEILRKKFSSICVFPSRSAHEPMIIKLCLLQSILVSETYIRCVSLSSYAGTYF